jgi:hypothetical protein
VFRPFRPPESENPVFDLHHSRRLKGLLKLGHQNIDVWKLGWSFPATPLSIFEIANRLVFRCNQPCPNVHWIATHKFMEPVTRPFSAIDAAIIAAGSTAISDNNLLECEGIAAAFAKAVLGCLSVAQRNWRDDPVRAIFDKALGVTSKALVAGCLVRLWAASPDLFTKEQTLRLRSVELFDAVFSHRLYPRLKISEKSQPHAKTTALIEAFHEVLLGFTDAAGQLKDVASAGQFEKAFFQIYKKVAADSFVAPFLPRSVQPKLHSALARLEKYREASPSDIVSSYESAVQALDLIVDECVALGTDFAANFLAAPLLRLRTSLIAHFEGSPLKQEANFHISRSDKKYPFQVTGIAINLEIEIENVGPGYASDVEVNVLEISSGRVARSTVQIGDMAPSKRKLPVEIVLGSPVSDVMTELELSWATFDRTRHTLRTTLEFIGQPGDIDWATFAVAEPYDVEPIRDDNELVGRAEILQQLTAMVSGKALGSAIVLGQKRVGKTSIVKALQSRLARNNSSVHTIYALAGEYVRPDPIRSIRALGERLCSEIQCSDPVFADMQAPVFDDALAPLGDFIRSAQRRLKKKFLIILDEFDELPVELYTHNDVANAFFLSIRSLSVDPDIGFILVGSERMSAMMSFQGQNLNKFRAIRVDYFDRQAHWLDFVNLVRQPSQGYLEFSDRAVETLYAHTAGNPYFTKLICKSIVKLMVNRRDGHVTDSEVSEACITELRNVDINSFVHFWEDGIVEKGADRDKIFLNRRKTLVAFGEVLRRTLRMVSVQQVQVSAREHELSDGLVKAELDEFVQRQVLENVDGLLQVRVRLFSDWLREYGVSQIWSGLTGRIAAIERTEADIAYVRSEEIFELVNNGWRYKGQPISPEAIRVWLNQFGSEANQRMMFKVLQSVKFYSEAEIRSRLSDLHAIIAGRVTLPLRHGTARVGDLAVSYLEGPGKSGYQYARLYAEENKVLARNVVEPLKIESVFMQSNVKAVLWVDDFIGTGSTALQRFTENRDVLVKLQKERDLSYFFGAISGIPSSQVKLEDALRDIGLRVDVRICDSVGDDDFCFSERSRVFVDEQERERAKRVAEDFGRRATPRTPLGFGDCGTTVVFERSCPNNNVAILWANSNGWVPVFAR